jgi:hypothetical protein
MVLWGLGLVQIYNDAYQEILGSQCRPTLGLPTKHHAPEGWATNWELYRHLFGSAVEPSKTDRTFACPGFPERSQMTIAALRDQAGAARGILIRSSSRAL